MNSLPGLDAYVNANLLYAGSMRRALPHAALSALFRSLADPTRLRLLHLLEGREICVCYFVEALGASQPMISRHLALLRRAGLVHARRAGKWMHYRLVMPAGKEEASVLRETLRQLRNDGKMKSDMARLSSACCESSRHVTLRKAPAPARISKRLRNR